ncbi:hypothetical protein HG531_003659 [Fusarium graminearum]|nr:hypothetical protein HG531_003659 [Fusarium graminearum]
MSMLIQLSILPHLQLQLLTRVCHESIHCLATLIADTPHKQMSLELAVGMRRCHYTRHIEIALLDPILKGIEQRLWVARLADKIVKVLHDAADSKLQP